MNKPKTEVPEAKSLRWLANMFPFTEKPEDETDKVTNAIHLYCSAGAAKIDELQSKLDNMDKSDEICLWSYLEKDKTTPMETSCGKIHNRQEESSSFSFCPYCGRARKTNFDS